MLKSSSKQNLVLTPQSNSKFFKIHFDNHSEDDDGTEMIEASELNFDDDNSNNTDLVYVRDEFEDEDFQRMEGNGEEPSQELKRSKSLD